MTTKEILTEWLIANVNQNIAYHDIEQKLPDYGLHYYNKLHNASTYARVFRKLRENKNELRMQGIDVVELCDIDSVAGKWKVIKSNGEINVNRNS